MIKVGVQSDGWFSDYCPEKWESDLEYIKSCGFDAVDFNFDNYLSSYQIRDTGFYDNLFDKSIDELIAFFTPLKKAIEKTGVTLAQSHAPFPVYFYGLDEINDYLFMALDKCFAVCEYLNCPAIVVHPARGKGVKQDLETSLDLYKRLIPVIKKYKGVKICLENLFDHQNTKIVQGPCSKPQDACDMIDQLNAESGGDYFGFCFDTGHANLVRQDLGEYIRTLGHRLTVLHIHDNDGIQDLHMIPYSHLLPDLSQSTDWNSFIQGLKDIGFGGTLNFETSRIYMAYPKTAHTSALKLIADIGRFWADELDKAKH